MRLTNRTFLALGFSLLALALGSSCATPRTLINAKHPLGPYSGGVLVGNTLYLSGQLGLHPDSGDLAEGGAAGETDQAIQNLGSVLKEAGFDYGDVVRATVFLTDVNDYAAMNKVYARYFGDSPPARACVEVSELVKGACVEISCVAAK